MANPEVHSQPQDSQPHESAPGTTEVRFSSYTGRATKPKPLSFVVQNILLKSSLAALVGPTESMKTMLVVSMFASIVSGRPWFGHEVCKGAAFMILGEGNTRISRRFTAYEIENRVSLKGAPLFFSNKGDDMSSLTTARAVGDRIAAKADKVGVCPRIICIDPVNKAMGSGDENAASDITRFLTTVESELVRRFGCVVLLVHHTGHQNNGRARGSSAFKAGIDTELIITRDQSHLTLKCSKQKDIDHFGEMGFEAKIVDLPWKDQAGKPETSIVLVPSRGGGVRAGKQEAAIELLRSLEKRYGRRGVPVREWKALLAEEEVVVKSSAYDKLRHRLREKGLIEVVENGKVRSASG